jgi:hypothetical protein
VPYISVRLCVFVCVFPGGAAVTAGAGGGVAKSAGAVDVARTEVDIRGMLLSVFVHQPAICK